MPRVNVTLTDKQLALLRSIANKSGIRFSEIIRRAVDAYLCARKLKD